MKDELRLLLPCIRREILRRDTIHPVFHGSWDWHSAVHGHWALLQGARLLDDGESLSWGISRLCGPGMKEEFSYLQNNSAFEMPYGRAWLLRLMVTFEQLAGKLPHRAESEAIAGGILEWLSKTPFETRGGEYENPAWTLIQLHTWANHAGDGAIQSWVESHARNSNLSPVSSLEVDHEGQGEFFSPWALHAHLLSTVLGPDELKEWLSHQEIGAETLRVVKEHNSVHHLAINASRAWGFGAAFHATGEERWKKAFDTHVNASLSLHSEWETNRYAYAHWVPQFTLYAMAMRHADSVTEERGSF